MKIFIFKDHKWLFNLYWKQYFCLNLGKIIIQSFPKGVTNDTK